MNSKMLNRKYSNGIGGVKCYCCGATPSAKAKDREEARKEIRSGMAER